MKRLLFLLLLVAGCVPDTLDFDFRELQPPPPPDEARGEVEVGTATDGGLTVALTAERGGPHLGYVRLGFAVTDASGQAITNAAVSVAATSRSGPATGVALPVESPVLEDGVFRGGAFLLALEAEPQGFTIMATVEADGRRAEVDFPVEARADVWMQATGDLIVSWVDPLRPTVGVNPYSVAVHRWTGTAFVPADDLEADLYPYMDMGGGDGHSTPFARFREPSPGLYAWDVDFIMSGGWDMTVRLTPPGATEQSVMFEGYTVYEPEVQR